ncbi:MAG: hypothetical protein Q7T33_02670 [Dehalococcoidia bacterium]|nr:hypothetical protein [Dehalococcoidia bacterium]
MARTRPYRPICFDRIGLIDARLEFVVTPPAGRTSLSVGGALLLAGEQLDKRRVDARRLRQMYEARLIALAPGSTLPAARKSEKGPLAIGPTALPGEAQPARAARGVPRRRLKRAA